MSNRKIIAICLTLIMLGTCNLTHCVLSQEVVEHLQKQIEEVDRGIDDLKAGISQNKQMIKDVFEPNHLDTSGVEKGISDMSNQISVLKKKKEELLRMLGNDTNPEPTSAVSEEPTEQLVESESDTDSESIRPATPRKYKRHKRAKKGKITKNQS